MLDRIGTHRTDDLDSRGEFTTSFRAQAACTRELSRLYDEITAGVAAWRGPSRAADRAPDEPPPGAPVIRRSPDRCLVQVGPVALTLAWLLRAQRTVADGELLAVVWRGVVGVRAPRVFERSDHPVAASSATALWEMVLTVDAPSEARWEWAPVSTAETAMSSSELARRCVEHLRAAHTEELARGR